MGGQNRFSVMLEILFRMDDDLSTRELNEQYHIFFNSRSIGTRCNQQYPTKIARLKHRSEK